MHFLVFLDRPVNEMGRNSCPNFIRILILPCALSLRTVASVLAQFRHQIFQNRCCIHRGGRHDLYRHGRLVLQPTQDFSDRKDAHRLGGLLGWGRREMRPYFCRRGRCSPSGRPSWLGEEGNASIILPTGKMLTVWEAFLAGGEDAHRLGGLLGWGRSAK